MKVVRFARRHLVVTTLLIVLLAAGVVFAIGYDRHGQGTEVPGDRDDVFQTP